MINWAGYKDGMSIGITKQQFSESINLELEREGDLFLYSSACVYFKDHNEIILDMKNNQVKGNKG